MDLTESNPTRVGLPQPEPGLLATPEAYSYEPEPPGLPSAREAVAAHLSSRGAQRLPRAPGPLREHQRGLRVALQAAV